jgi:hypothetical protein
VTHFSSRASCCSPRTRLLLDPAHGREELRRCVDLGARRVRPDDDPELIRDALPFGLKTLESLLEILPDHRAYCSPAVEVYPIRYAFVQADADLIEARDPARAAELKERALHLYLRARGFGLRGLALRHKGITDRLQRDPVGAAAELRKEDLPFAYWTAAAWGSAISVGSDRPELVVDLSAVKALLERALALDESYEQGALHEAMIILEALPPAMGGSAERARTHFQRAVELSGGVRAGPYVTLASTVSVQSQKPRRVRALVEAGARSRSESRSRPAPRESRHPAEGALAARARRRLVPGHRLPQRRGQEMNSLARCSAVLLLLFVAALPARAQTTTTIKLATLVPDGSVWDRILKIRAPSGRRHRGRVTLRIYPGGVSGDEPDMVRKLRMRQIQAAALTTAGLADIDPAFQVFGIPMFYDSYPRCCRCCASSSRVAAAARGERLRAVALGSRRLGPFFSKQTDQDAGRSQELEAVVWAVTTAWCKLEGQGLPALALSPPTSCRFSSRDDRRTADDTARCDVTPVVPQNALHSARSRPTRRGVVVEEGVEQDQRGRPREVCCGVSRDARHASKSRCRSRLDAVSEDVEAWPHVVKLTPDQVSAWRDRRKRLANRCAAHRAGGHARSRGAGARCVPLVARRPLKQRSRASSIRRRPGWWRWRSCAPEIVWR